MRRRRKKRNHWLSVLGWLSFIVLMTVVIVLGTQGPIADAFGDWFFPIAASVRGFLAGR
jgi:hypothetical protein